MSHTASLPPVLFALSALLTCGSGCQTSCECTAAPQTCDSGGGCTEDTHPPGDTNSSSDTGDATGEVPEYYVRIPADPDLGTTSDFYVCKYEMKIQGLEDGDREYDASYQAECRPTGIPWQWLNQDQARAACEALGEGYALMTNEEWMTMARSIERTASNWSDGQTHETGTSEARMNMGHTCRNGSWGTDCRSDGVAYSGEALPASSNDEESCYGYFPVAGEEEAPSVDENGWNLYRRTFHLETGEVLWDVSGNVWEWVDWHVAAADDRAWLEGEEITNDWLEINEPAPTDAMPEESFKSANPEMVQSLNVNGLGRYHPTATDDDAGAAMRGGNFMHGDANNGLYALGMGYGPDTDHLQCRIGFRCAWHPE